MSYQSFGVRRAFAAATFARRKPARPVTLTSTVSRSPPTFAVSVRTSTSREAKPVPRRFTAPRLSHASKRTVASFGLVSRSASSSNFTKVFVGVSSAIHRQTRAVSGSNSAFLRAVSRRAVLTAPHATSRSTWTSTSVVPAWRHALRVDSISGTRPPSTTNSGLAP
jgi:hypothetical protein